MALVHPVSAKMCATSGFFHFTRLGWTRPCVYGTSKLCVEVDVTLAGGEVTALVFCLGFLRTGGHRLSACGFVLTRSS